MLLVYCILLVVVVLCIIPIFIVDVNYFYGIAAVILFMFLFISFAGVRTSNNPTLKDFELIQPKYNYISTHDSIPFEMKKKLYDECYTFNDNLSNYDKNHNNIWIGFYYPDLGIDRLKIDFFDLKNIK